MIEARTIAAAVPMRRGLEHVGWRVRSRGRADCGLCNGGSVGTLAYTERVWRCHRCAAGGDVLSLLMAAHGCDFRAALSEAADLAGIPLDNSRTTRREVEQRRRERERLTAAAERLAAEERRLRWAHAGCVFELGKLARRLAMENRDGRHDRLLAGLPEMIRRDAAAHTLLAFGAPPARVKFILQPECRPRAIEAVLSGLVRDADGNVLEVRA